MTTRVRLDWVASEVRDTVDPSSLGDQLVDHFSIPALDETGGPVTQPASEIESGKQLLAGGEVLVSRLNPRKARVVRPRLSSDRPSLCSGEFIVLRPRAIDGRFLEYVLVGESTRQYLDGAVQSVTRSHQRVRPEVLCKMWIDLPSAIEQQAIADFLDRETARIDALITAKRRMIAVLEERVSGMIDDAVWGRSEWATPSFSALVSVAQGQVDPTKAPYSEMPLVAPNHIESGTGRLTGVESASEQGAISGKYLCGKGDVIYSKIRPELSKATVAPYACLTSADMYPLRPRPELLPDFLLLVLLSRRFTDWAAMESDRVAMPKINRDALGRQRLPLPPPVEQRAIVSILAAQQKRADSGRALLTRQIELLIEHRQALITAAVTGELSIPGVAA